MDCILFQLVPGVFFKSLAQISSQDMEFGLSLQFWLWLQTHYLPSSGGKAGGELRCWMHSHFEHSAQLLICSQVRQGVALWRCKYEPVRATWLWGIVSFKDPFIYQEQCICQHSNWLFRLTGSVCIDFNITYSTFSVHTNLWQGAWPPLLWEFLEMMHCGRSNDSWVMVFQLWKDFWLSFSFYCKRKS